MDVAKRLDLVSVADYLAGELVSPTRHEYLGGVLYSMAGARNAHDLIATNTLVALGTRLRGRPCRPFNSDTKIRIRLPLQVRFYYPPAKKQTQPSALRAISNTSRDTPLRPAMRSSWARSSPWRAGSKRRQRPKAEASRRAATWGLIGSSSRMRSATKA
jgi:hypothetical protein